MNTKLENAKDSVLALSKELIAETRKCLIDKADGIVSEQGEVFVQKTHNVNAYQPLGVIGVSSVVVGGIGWICTSDVWPKWLFFAGLAALGVDFICLHRDKKEILNTDKNHQTSIVPLKVRYEIIDELSNLCGQINQKWDEKLSNWKETLLNDISFSNLSDEQKSNASFQLFHCQNIELSMTKWIPLFESKESPEQIKQLIAKFGVYVVEQIEDACRKQCKNYESAKML
ncbi:hypothetical protein BSEG_03994 [Phocaeicola dorei 5_1_36/D4]|uniref:hypothetical protein n=1 Tax=Phocaeicola dorei TaxID=357276 RepID=UPI0001A27031|nr:hypothetical protein [Phocaeicola dorei]EEO47853.1 hypothetical protein BSEG_03994 [Phocaeicola dorei 5_1_36/D4]